MAGDYTNQSEQVGYKWTYPTTISVPTSLINIEKSLERIADALEKMIIATPPPKSTCAICEKPIDFWTTAPYGSTHEDEKVCSECFDKLFEGV